MTCCPMHSSGPRDLSLGLESVGPDLEQLSLDLGFLVIKVVLLKLGINEDDICRSRST